MRTAWKLLASLVGITALALMAATTLPAANPNAAYTCVKVKENGQQDVRVGVPESAVAGLTNAGFTCVANPGEAEDPSDGEDPGNDDPGNDDPGTEDSANEDDPGDAGSGQASGPSVEVYVAPESRSVYCSTNGPAYRANGEGMGITLNLLDTQGTLMVELGLARPANFYQGIGASCDLLAGFKDSGVWVDHIGDVVPGVAVYPLFVTA